jgi:hypothetical protein
MVCYLPGIPGYTPSNISLHLRKADGLLRSLWALGAQSDIRRDETPYNKCCIASLAVGSSMTPLASEKIFISPAVIPKLRLQEKEIAEMTSSK